MTTAYNLRNQMFRGANAGRQLLLDPGSAGTVKVFPYDFSVLNCTTSGVRTLQAAAQIPLGTDVLVVCSQASGVVTVNSVAMGAGEFAEFRVTLSSAGANQWTLVNQTSIAGIAGDNSLSIPLHNFRTWDALQTVLPGTGANDDMGFVTGTWLTDAPYLRSRVATGSLTVYGGILFSVPLDYQAGDAMIVSVPWLRTVAATETATDDLEVVRQAAPTVDICQTATIDVNSAAAGTAVFVLTPTSIVPGEILFARLAIIPASSAASTDIKLTDFKLGYTN